MLAQLTTQPLLKQMMISAQKTDVELQEKVQIVKNGDKTDFSLKEAGSLYSTDNVCQMIKI